MNSVPAILLLLPICLQVLVTRADEDVIIMKHHSIGVVINDGKPMLWHEDFENPKSELTLTTTKNIENQLRETYKTIPLQFHNFGAVYWNKENHTRADLSLYFATDNPNQTSHWDKVIDEAMDQNPGPYYEARYSSTRPIYEGKVPDSGNVEGDDDTEYTTSFEISFQLELETMEWSNELLNPFSQLHLNRCMDVNDDLEQVFYEVDIPWPGDFSCIFWEEDKTVFSSVSIIVPFDSTTDITIIKEIELFAQVMLYAFECLREEHIIVVGWENVISAHTTPLLFSSRFARTTEAPSTTHSTIVVSTETDLVTDSTIVVSTETDSVTDSTIVATTEVDSSTDSTIVATTEVDSSTDSTIVPTTEVDSSTGSTIKPTVNDMLLRYYSTGLVKDNGMAVPWNGEFENPYSSTTLMTKKHIESQIRDAFKSIPVDFTNFDVVFWNKDNHTRADLSLNYKLDNLTKSRYWKNRMAQAIDESASPNYESRLASIRPIYRSSVSDPVYITGDDDIEYTTSFEISFELELETFEWSNELLNPFSELHLNKCMDVNDDIERVFYEVDIPWPGDFSCLFWEEDDIVYASITLIVPFDSTADITVIKEIELFTQVILYAFECMREEHIIVVGWENVISAHTTPLLFPSKSLVKREAVSPTHSPSNAMKSEYPENGKSVDHTPSWIDPDHELDPEFGVDPDKGTSMGTSLRSGTLVSMIWAGIIVALF